MRKPKAQTMQAMEDRISRISPGAIVQLDEITGRNADKAIINAAIMLLKKYGITYRGYNV